ncbi:hypothetical protein [Undibacterium flavidum]|uniref:Uncharacterized protein n=1 Tax=Undibacterium flavidum TaxID=2762297 RepID=A0ABR6YG55_9BURK|nr:hypothetical protein [Undibacterium flavidum]MBC3875551.1 hypothetical protein [Undibacterium flavidum]
MKIAFANNEVCDRMQSRATHLQYCELRRVLPLKPENLNNVKVESEHPFWVFKPDQNGWLVLKSDYVTGFDYKLLN